MMKKAMLGTLVFVSIILLSACNMKEKANSFEEMEVINENLRLKDKVAELEKELQEQRQQIDVEREILLNVNAFFQAINLGDAKEAMNYVTNRIIVGSNSLLLPNNRRMTIGKKEFFKLALVETEWGKNNRVCLTFNQLNQDSQLRMNVYVVKSSTDWKIDNMGLDFQ